MLYQKICVLFRFSLHVGSKKKWIPDYKNGLVNEIQLAGELENVFKQKDIVMVKFVKRKKGKFFFNV